MGGKAAKINVFGKQVDVLLIVGLVIFAVGILSYSGFYQSPKTYDSQGLEQKLAERIKAQVPISSKEDAKNSIIAISQELEQVKGSVSKINDNLDGSTQEDIGPSGLAVLSFPFAESLVLLGVVLLVLGVLSTLQPKPKFT